MEDPLINSNSENEKVQKYTDMIQGHIKRLEEVKGRPDEQEHILKDFDHKTLADIMKQLNPAGNIRFNAPLKEDVKYSILSTLHPTRQVMINEIMIAAMGYLFQSADEYEYYLSPEDKDRVEAEYLKEHPEERDLEKATSAYIKKKTEEDKPAIDRFLNRFFKFNPNIHVKRIGEFKIENVEVPANAFQGFEHYVAMHHTDISQIVREKIFNGAPLNIRDYVCVHASGLSEKDADAKYEALKRTTLMPIYKIPEGAMVITGDEKVIRENLDLSGNDMLTRILDKQKTDRELSNHLMKNRVKLAKMENIRRHGPDDPEFRKHVRELYPERDQELEPFEREELERLAERYFAKKLEERDRKALEDAPVGTKAMKFTEFGDPNEPVKEYVMYTDVGHYLVSDGQSDTSVVPVSTPAGN
jgi:hypothetical protein